MRTVSEAPSGRRFRSNRSLASCWVMNSVVMGRCRAMTSFTVVSMWVISSSVGACGRAKSSLLFLRSAASEEVDHGTVYDVFARVHGRIFRLVVFVELRLFHNSFLRGVFFWCIMTHRLPG